MQKLQPEALPDSPPKGLYIFFTSTVANLGGGQLYLSSKVSWLESIGWDVKVYYIHPGKIYLDNLRKFENSCCGELTIRFSAYSNADRKRISYALLGDYMKYDKIIIESYTDETALWGEYMARLCEGTHLCFFLAERLGNITGDMREFLRFKLNQGLLFGINSSSIPALIPEADGEAAFLTAEGCSEFNALDFHDDRLDDIPEDGFTVLTVSRLEKPYMLNVFKEVLKFSENISEPVNFIIVGDTTDNKVKEKLFAILKEAGNVRVFFWGFTFPIPKRLYEKSDVFIGGAGSANLAFKERIPVITVDAVDCEGIGILGETTENRIYRNPDEPAVPVHSLLATVYSEKEERRKRRADLKPIVELPDFTHHLEIMNASYEKKYYPVEIVKSSKWIRFIYTPLVRIGGSRLFLNLKKIKHTVKAGR